VLHSVLLMLRFWQLILTDIKKRMVAEAEENVHSEEIQDVSKDNSEETAEPTNTKEIHVEEPSKLIEQLDSSSIDPTF